MLPHHNLLMSSFSDSFSLWFLRYELSIIIFGDKYIFEHEYSKYILDVYEVVIVGAGSLHIMNKLFLIAKMWL